MPGFFDDERQRFLVEATRKVDDRPGTRRDGDPALELPVVLHHVVGAVTEETIHRSGAEAAGRHFGQAAVDGETQHPRCRAMAYECAFTQPQTDRHQLLRLGLHRRGPPEDARPDLLPRFALHQSRQLRSAEARQDGQRVRHQPVLARGKRCQL